LTQETYDSYHVGMTTPLRKRYLQQSRKLREKIIKDYRHTRSARKTAENLSCSFQWVAKVMNDYLKEGGKL